MSKFFGQPMLGMITSIQVGVDKELEASGDTKEQEIVKFKLESANIEDPQMEEFYPGIITVIRAMSPCPAEEIKFSAVFGKLKLEIMPAEDEKDKLFPDMENNYLYGRVSIDKITVKLKQDIPVYIFEMAFPIGYGSIGDMTKNFKKKIKFELTEMTIDEYCDNTKKAAEDLMSDLKETADKLDCNITISSGDKSAIYKSKKNKSKLD